MSSDANVMLMLTLQRQFIGSGRRCFGNTTVVMVLAAALLSFRSGCHGRLPSGTCCRRTCFGTAAGKLLSDEADNHQTRNQSIHGQPFTSDTSGLREPANLCQFRFDFDHGAVCQWSSSST